MERGVELVTIVKSPNGCHEHNGDLFQLHILDSSGELVKYLYLDKVCVGRAELGPAGANPSGVQCH